MNDRWVLLTDYNYEFICKTHSYLLVKFKLLGVDINVMLNFDKPIKTICRKDVQQFYILKRIGRHLCKLSRITIYTVKFLLLSHVLAFLFSGQHKENNIKKKIQERGLRFVYYDSTYEDLLVKAQCCYSLEYFEITLYK